LGSRFGVPNADHGALHSFLRHPSGTRGHNARHHEEAATQDAFSGEASAERGARAELTKATARTRADGPAAARPRSSCGSSAERRSTPSAARSASRPASSPSGVTRRSPACRPGSSRASPTSATASSTTSRPRSATRPCRSRSWRTASALRRGGHRFEPVDITLREEALRHPPRLQGVAAHPRHRPRHKALANTEPKLP